MSNFLRAHLNFKIYGVTLAAFFVAVSIIPCVMFLPERFGWENGILENIQLLILFIGFYLALKPNSNKKFFNFAAMVLVILMLREVQCGRTIFFAVPGAENTFYTWKQIKYGYLAHPIYGMYIAYVGFYFLKNKLFLTVWDFLSKTKLPIWNIILMFAGMFLGTYAEHATHNFVFEEISEVLFYLSLVGLIYLYSRVKDFGLNVK